MASPVILKILAVTEDAQAAINQLNKKLDTFEANTKKATTSTDKLGKSADLAAVAFKTLAGAFAINEVINITTAWTDLNSRLVNATGSQEQANKAMAAISRTANTTYSSLEQTAEVFLRNSMAMNELGYTTSEQIKISEVLNNALAVSAVRGDQAASVLDAFAKSMARGKIQGEDFNRIVENSPRLVKALADGLGVTTGELRNMATEGKLNSDVVIPALTSQMGKLRAEAEAMPATINDAFIIFRNRLVETIGRLDQATGASTKVATVLVVMANNLELAAVAGGTFMLVLAAPRILAMAKAMIAFNLAVSRNPLVLLAIGASAAAAALYEFFVASKKAETGQDDLGDAIAEAEAATKRATMAQEKLNSEQNKGLESFFAKLDLQTRSINLSYEQQEIEKALAQAATELKVKEQDLTSEVRQQVIERTKARVAAEQLKKTQDFLLIQSQAITQASITDNTERQISAKLAEYRKQVDEKTYEANKNTVAALERQRIVIEATNAITAKRQEIEQNISVLAISDLNVREEELAVARERAKVGAAFTAEMEAQVRANTKLEQQNRRMLAVDQARRQLAGEMTREEEIQRGVGLQSRLDELGELQRQYDMDQRALKALLDEKLIDESRYQNQRVQLERESNQKILAARQKMAGDAMRSAGVTSDVIVKTVQDQMAAVQMMQQGGIVGVQGALGALSNVFGAMAGQSKSAFETHKKLAIAQAMISTYQAAAMAIAFPPGPPISLLYVAGAIAAGLAQVSAIRSQQYSGRRVGGPVVGGKGYMVGETGPEIFTPGVSGSITKNSDIGSGSVNVNFTINAVDAAGIDSLLVQRRGLITQIINDAMIERGQRGI